MFLSFKYQKEQRLAGPDKCLWYSRNLIGINIREILKDRKIKPLGKIK